MGVAAAVYALSSVLWSPNAGQRVAFNSMIMLGAAYSLTIAADPQRMDRGDA